MYALNVLPSIFFGKNMLLCLILAAVNGAEVYVSSVGSDTTGDGTQAKPYATLDFTKAAVQQLM